MNKDNQTIISALCWVDRGYAAAQLKEYEPTVQELQRHQKLQKKLLKGQDAEGDIGQTTKEIEKNIAELQIEEKDVDFENMDDEDEFDAIPNFTSELKKLKKPSKKDKQNKDQQMEDDSDEYEDVGMLGEFSESEDEKDDCLIRKTDSLIVAATAENDHSSLEVYIYDHKTSDLYVHHEILLGSYPLCLQWLHSWQGVKSNHIIVGNFLPEIEIWNLDSENVEPTAVLGSVQNSEKAKKGLIKSYSKKKNQQTEEDYGTHTDAVMCLSLNPIQLEYLASGSVDTTVRIWDLDDLQCKATFRHHKDKVQAVKWNCKSDKTLLSAGYDHRLIVMDVRDQASYLKAKLPKSAGDIETANWHPVLEHNFAVSTESGQIFGYDTRNFDQPLFTIQAHEQSCSQVCFSPHIPSLMASAGTDGYIKIWDISSGANPQEISTKDVKQGEIFSLQFCRDIPWVLAAGGSKGELAIWDTSESSRIEKHFKSMLIEGSYKLDDYNPKEDKMPEQINEEDNEDSDSSKDKKKKKKKKSKK